MIQPTDHAFFSIEKALCTKVGLTVARVAWPLHKESIVSSIAWQDTREYYGRITRLFHWLMAALLLWQFAGMIAANLVGRVPWVSFMVGTHKSTGTLLMLLIVLRSIWGLYNLSHRPPHDRGAELLVGFGQLLLYLLMILVPLLGLTMNWASGKSLEVLGVQLMGSGKQMSGLARLTANWHVWMAWTLGVLIAGHVLLAVVWHGIIRRDNTLEKMATRPTSHALTSHRATLRSKDRQK